MCEGQNSKCNPFSLKVSAKPMLIINMNMFIILWIKVWKYYLFLLLYLHSLITMNIYVYMSYHTGCLNSRSDCTDLMVSKWNNDEEAYSSTSWPECVFKHFWMNLACCCFLTWVSLCVRTFGCVSYYPCINNITTAFTTISSKNFLHSLSWVIFVTAATFNTSAEKDLED